MPPTDVTVARPWAIYVRSAGNDQASIQHQIRACTRWLLDRNMTVSVTVFDSITLTRRIAEGHFAGVVISRVDRLPRTPRESLRLVDACAAHATPLHAVDQGELTAIVTLPRLTLDTRFG